MISSILSRPLQVLSRSSLEALVKNIINEDLSQYSDDELKDLIVELYPLDVISSLSFARMGTDNKEFEEVDIAKRDFLKDSIDIILGDASWCYVFWNINAHTLSKIVKEDSVYSIFLRVKETYKKGDDEISDFFDIEVQNEERERNIYIQGDHLSFSIELYVKKNGGETLLAESHNYKFPVPYFLEHKNEKPNSLFFEPFLNKDGNLVLSNTIIKKLYEDSKVDEE